MFRRKDVETRPRQVCRFHGGTQNLREVAKVNRVYTTGLGRDARANAGLIPQDVTDEMENVV
jgi:hypothetical protein